MNAFDANGELPPGTVLLEASAGTGKTYAIAHVVMRFVAELDVPIDAVLVVTFTEAAAAELRERVRARLRDAHDAFETGATPADATLAAFVAGRVEAGEATLARRRLRAALDAFDTATIATIHGFCHRILSRFAFESDADADLELVASHAETIRHLVYDHLARRLEDAPGAVAAERLRGRLGTTIPDLVKLATAVASHPDVVLRPEDPGYPTEFDDQIAATLAALQVAWTRERDALRFFVMGALDAGALLRSRYNPLYLDKRFDAIDRLVADEKVDRFDERYLPHLGRAMLAESLRGRDVSAYAARLDELEAPRALDAHLAARAKLDAFVHRYLLALRHELARLVRDELPDRARRARTRTFDELLRAVRDGVAAGPDTELARKIRGLHRVALIDEFQDTDEVQWAIFERVFHDAGAPLWLIGDPKQSIYGFRGADLETYFRARERAATRFALDTNHRTDASLVAAVNHLFSRHANPFEDARIAFTPALARNERSRFSIDGRTVPPLLIRPHVPPKGARDTTLEARVADDIVALLDRDATIEISETERRRVGPGDVAVLVRSRTEARKILEALRRRGVPAVLRIDESVFSTQEALDLLRFIKAIVEPSRLANVRAAMATALVGASAETIDALGRDEALLDAWLARFRGYGEVLRRDGFVRAARAAIEDFDVEQRFLAETGGERRVTDLAHAIELVHVAAVRDRIAGPALAAWLEARRAEGDDIEDEARRVRLDNDRNAVVLATMHKSKGLEYPVVFLPSLGASVFDPAGATFIEVRDRDRKLLFLDPPSEPTAQRRREHDDLRELLRLAYVGLTRAKHMCVVHAQLRDGKLARKRAFRSPLATLLLANGEHEGDFAATVARIAEHGDDDAFRAPFVDVPKLVAVGPPQRRAQPKVPRELPTYGPLAARTITRSPLVDALFRFSSFTSVVAAGEAPLESGQRDEAESNVAPPRAPAPQETIASRVRMADLPGGKNLGNLVHEVLEGMDFDAHPDLSARLAESLERYGVPAEPHLETLAAALEDVLGTALRDDDPTFRLGAIARRDTLRELAFTFPVASDAPAGRVSARAIARVFSAHPRPSLPAGYATRLAGLQTAPLRGYLHGSIDLVVRHRGLHYVVDYKTNDLGESPSDYTPDRLVTAMMESHYPLQAHLYGVAVHRHLGRVLRGYDYDACFGGFLYLFLRGMSPERGARTGVYFDRPPRAHIEALDDLLRRGEVER